MQGLPSLASSIFFGWPQRSSMMRLRSAAFLSCSFFNSSAAFFLNNNYEQMYDLMEGGRGGRCVIWSKIGLTLNFFFLSGVMKPFLAFLALEASSIRFLTSALLRSISACLALFACNHREIVNLRDYRLVLPLTNFYDHRIRNFSRVTIYVTKNTKLAFSHLTCLIDPFPL